MKSCLLFCMILFFTGCQQNKDNALESLKKEVKKNPSSDNVTQLLNRYTSEIRSHPDDLEANKPLIIEAYTVSKQHNRTLQKLGFLQSLVLDYHDDPETPDRILEIGETFESLNRKPALDAIYLGFLEAYPDHPRAEAVRSKVSENVPLSLDSLIRQTGRQMFNDSTFRLDPALARKYVDACEAYALTLPDQPNAVEYLHKAAETARNLRTVPKALSLYDWILRVYPGHPRAAQALFLKAYEFDNSLNDTANARKYYQMFLDKYPDNDFAESARFLLENLGKSDEELLEELKSKGREVQ